MALIFSFIIHLYDCETENIHFVSMCKWLEAYLKRFSCIVSIQQTLYIHSYHNPVNWLRIKHTHCIHEWRVEKSHGLSFFPLCYCFDRCYLFPDISKCTLMVYSIHCVLYVLKLVRIENVERTNVILKRLRKYRTKQQKTENCVKMEKR